MNETNQELINLMELAKKETPAGTEVTINERRIKNGLKPIPGGSVPLKKKVVRNKMGIQEANKKYDGFLSRSQTEINELKKELINLAKSECETYRGIGNFLGICKKRAVWENDVVLVEIINGVIEYFKEEKNGLSVK